MYRTSASESTWYTDTAGTISIYSRTTTGTVETTEVVSSVGIKAQGSLATSDGYEEEGSYSGTLAGNFNRIGLAIHITGYSALSAYYNAYIAMIVRNFLIDGRKTAFPKSAEF
jgi:hypothetical protein